jgi:hypothetical protein
MMMRLLGWLSSIKAQRRVGDFLNHIHSSTHPSTLRSVFNRLSTISIFEKQK